MLGHNEKKGHSGALYGIADQQHQGEYYLLNRSILGQRIFAAKHAVSSTTRTIVNGTLYTLRRILADST
jgi:hypothetical protein